MNIELHGGDGDAGKQNAAAGKRLLPVNSGLTLDQVMSRVRDEVRQRRAQQTAQATPSGDGPARPAPWVARLPIKPAYALAELLQFADQEFVEVAYRTLLRRPAEGEGMSHYLEALRNGYLSKVEILGKIRFSDEGRANDVHVDGLLLPYKMHGWRRVPVVGRLLGFGMALARLPRLSSYLQTMESASGRQAQHLRSLVDSIDHSVESQLEALREDFRNSRSIALEVAEAREKALHAELSDELNRFVDARVDAALASVSERVIGRIEIIEARMDALDRRANDQDEGFRQAREALASDIHDVRRTATDLQRKVMQRFDAPQASSVSIGASAPMAAVVQDDLLDSHYVAFEDAFRGKRDDIKARAAYYLGPLREAGILDGVVLDLGCGRGEWLEVLKEHGYVGRGVDLNEAMTDDARALGLDAIHADALAYLRSLPDASVAAVTSMHLVEHLPEAVLVRMIDEVLRVLRPGGIVALETPNPENITVGSCYFYLDPTHKNPIPPVYLQWLVARRGFEDATVHRLFDHRGGMNLPALANEIPGASQVNAIAEWFTAATDYAIVARRPMPAGAELVHA